MTERKEKMERICKNCRLFNEHDNVCSVTVIILGEHYELPVHPRDHCHWEQIDGEIQNELKDKLDKSNPYFRARLEPEIDHPIEVKQVRIWSDGRNGHIEIPNDN